MENIEENLVEETVNLESSNEVRSFKRLNEYEPIDFLKALVDNYKDKREL